MLRNAIIVLGSIFSCILLLLTIFPPVVAFQIVTNQEHQKILTLKVALRNTPQRQGIAFKIIYFILALIFFLMEFLASLSDATNILLFLYILVFSLLWGLFWPITEGYMLIVTIIVIYILSHFIPPGLTNLCTSRGELGTTFSLEKRSLFVSLFHFLTMEQNGSLMHLNKELLRKPLHVLDL